MPDAPSHRAGPTRAPREWARLLHDEESVARWEAHTGLRAARSHRSAVRHGAASALSYDSLPRSARAPRRRARRQLRACSTPPLRPKYGTALGRPSGGLFSVVVDVLYAGSTVPFGRPLGGGSTLTSSSGWSVRSFKLRSSAMSSRREAVRVGGRRRRRRPAPRARERLRRRAHAFPRCAIASAKPVGRVAKSSSVR